MSNVDPNEEITPFPFFNSPSGASPSRERLAPRARPGRPIRVLLIEDNRGDVRLIEEYLAEVEGLSFHLENVNRFSAGLERLAHGGVDVVLLDLSLPDSRGLDTFVRLQAAAPGVPVVVLTGFNDEVLAVKRSEEHTSELQSRVD